MNIREIAEEAKRGKPMMGIKQLSEMLPQIILWYKQGKSCVQIAEEIGTHSSNIGVLLRRNGVSTRNRGQCIKLAHEMGRFKEDYYPRGPLSPQWKGGRSIHSEGYVMIFAPDHPRSNMRGYVAESVLIVERAIGRRLKHGEVVHHIDRNRANNMNNNLVLMTDSAHKSLHVRLRKRDTKGRLLKEYSKPIEEKDA